MKSDFINIYAGIGNKSQKEFKQYIYCFYGNQKQILAGFEEIETVLATKDEKVLQAFRKMGQETKEKKEEEGKKIRSAKNDYGDLKKWLFEYLALQEIRGGNIEGKFLSLEALRKLDLYEVVEQTSKQIRRGLDEEITPSLWHLLWKMRLLDIDYYNVSLDGLQDHKPDMIALMRYLDDFYISAKLKYSAEFYSRSRVLQDEFDIILLDEILALLKSEHPTTLSISNLYKPLLELTKDHSREAYIQLKKFLIEKPQYDTLERRFILQYLLNYTTTRLRKKDETMIAESFELYQYGIEQSLFIFTGYFLKNTFLNIVNTACRLGKYEWADKFVKQYTPKLHPLEKDETELLANARIRFEEKKFPEVLTLLSKASYNNLNFKLNVWTLKLRAFYELEEPHETMSQANKSFYKFVMSNKEIGNALRTNVLGFISMYRLLIANKSKKRLFKELNTMSNSIICYDWIKIKIDALPNQL